MNDSELRCRILLSLQRALLGAVTRALRGVTVGWHDKVIEIICYFEGPICAKDQVAMDSMHGEILADFWPEFEVKLSLVRNDFPGAMTSLQAWAYWRCEDDPTPTSA